MEMDLVLPTQFTAAQLETLNALVQKEASRGKETPEEYNLRRKLSEYCSQVRTIRRFRRTG